jgi:hypothetical protein
MLIKIAEVIGGSVIITGKGKYVIWMVNKKETIQEIIKIFNTYPLLTSKKMCQLDFLKKCILRNSVYWYLKNRNNKYVNQKLAIYYCIFELEKDFNNNGADYFKKWFSGYVEAKGCFSIRKNNNHYFSIGQNDDFCLIIWIEKYLSTTNIIKNPYGNFYSLEIYKKETIKTIINHFNNYPLLGEKAESFYKWKQKI